MKFICTIALGGNNFLRSLTEKRTDPGFSCQVGSTVDHIGISPDVVASIIIPHKDLSDSVCKEILPFHLK